MYRKSTYNVIVFFLWILYGVYACIYLINFSFFLFVRCPGNNVYRGSVQQKGMGMVPKRAVDVMSCQIVRFLQLTQSSIIPVAYHVQRKVSRFSLSFSLSLSLLFSSLLFLLCYNYTKQPQIWNY